MVGQFAVYCDSKLQDLYDTRAEAEAEIKLAISEHPELDGLLECYELDKDGDPK